jgi:hypothetical protein
MLDAGGFVDRIAASDMHRLGCMAPVEFTKPHEPLEGTLSTSGGLSQEQDNAFMHPPEAISDAEQIFDARDTTLDRQARNFGLTREREGSSSDRQRFRFLRFLASLRR